MENSSQKRTKNWKLRKESITRHFPSRRSETSTTTTMVCYTKAFSKQMLTIREKLQYKKGSNCSHDAVQ